MNLRRVTQPTAPRPTPDERRARAEELHRRVTASLHVRPPADGDVTSGCGLCGVAAVTVPGDRVFTEAVRRTVRVCRACRGTGTQRMGPEATGPCRLCDGANPPPDGVPTGEVEFDATVEVAARDLPRDALARKLWRRIHAPPAALGAAGSRPVTTWLCETCAGVHADVGSVGFVLVERLLADAGFPLNANRGDQLRTLRGVTHAGRVLTARRRDRPEPRPGTSPWEHLSREAIRT